MNKIFLVSISLLVFLVAVASASAADVNSTVGDDCTMVVDQDCGITEISNDVSDAVDVNVDDAVAVDDSNAGSAVDVNVNDVADVHGDVKSIDSQKSQDNTGDRDLFGSDGPNRYHVTKDKLDSLHAETEKYTQHFKKNRGISLTGEMGGTYYDFCDLILDVYRTHNYVDTVIIVTQVTKNVNMRLSYAYVEQVMNQMRSGGVHAWFSNKDPNYYMHAMHQIESAPSAPINLADTIPFFN